MRPLHTRQPVPVPLLPFPRAYWVVEGSLLAGAYPGAVDPEEAAVKLHAVLHAGIRCIINLTEVGETNHAGVPLRNYELQLQEIASALGHTVWLSRHPIPDQGVPSTTAMCAILDAIDHAMRHDRPVYVHCWGGKGRTATVIGCWLARHGIAGGDHALRAIQVFRRYDPMAQEPAPENRLQCEYVRRWPKGR